MVGWGAFEMSCFLGVDDGVWPEEKIRYTRLTFKSERDTQSRNSLICASVDQSWISFRRNRKCQSGLRKKEGTTAMWIEFFDFINYVISNSIQEF